MQCHYYYARRRDYYYARRRDDVAMHLPYDEGIEFGQLILHLTTSQHKNDLSARCYLVSCFINRVVEKEF